MLKNIFFNPKIWLATGLVCIATGLRFIINAPLPDTVLVQLASKMQNTLGDPQFILIFTFIWLMAILLTSYVIPQFFGKNITVNYNSALIILAPATTSFAALRHISLWQVFFNLLLITLGMHLIQKAFYALAAQRY